jgi:hypothetical protein
MNIKYNYASLLYETREAAEAGKQNQDSRLENNPTDYIVIKEVTGSNESGWLVSPSTLTDSEIQNLDMGKTYSVYSPVTGENLLGMSAAEVQEKITEYKNTYRSYKNFDAGIIEVDIDLFVPEAEIVIEPN